MIKTFSETTDDPSSLSHHDGVWKDVSCFGVVAREMEMSGCCNPGQVFVEILEQGDPAQKQGATNRFPYFIVVVSGER